MGVFDFGGRRKQAVLVDVHVGTDKFLVRMAASESLDRNPCIGPWVVRLERGPCSGDVAWFHDSRPRFRLPILSQRYLRGQGMEADVQRKKCGRFLHGGFRME